MSDYEKDLLSKIDSGDRLSERELKMLALEFDIERIEGGNRRWQREVRSICQLGERTFAVDWQEGLTECQENEFWEQPIEVVKIEREKTINVIEWIKKVEVDENGKSINSNK
ncbi:hypothetical protein C8E03_108119 [Lachnotalea glycerini]|uniref:Uncharacterized protein n=1 Tax=Lachnotalea glycerini TaxID=1763509 RepID=A0A318EQG6_9FIRM|nr:hypothetical protein [Lachnotalea glycerini]PXV88392.1 hypothetical protein C8E03_108119 [Lachnotalea glycerini]